MRRQASAAKRRSPELVLVGGHVPGLHLVEGFLLASAKELEHVELVVVDGEAIVKRVLGELIDLQSFDEKAYECIGTSSKGLHARIRELYAYLQKMTGEVEPCVPGVPRQVAARLVAVQSDDGTDDNDIDEDWGDLDEASW